MTEADWLAGRDPAELVGFLRGRTSERKLRLWACACVRRIWDLIPDELGRRAVIVCEQFAEGRAREADVRAIADAFYPCGLYNASYGHPATRAAHSPLYLELVPQTAGLVQQARRRNERVDEQAAQVGLVHHIFGNPFRPSPQTGMLPALVHALAERVYVAQDGTFALHDALLDAGHAELAEHFSTPEHPRGCWALDLILGKE